MICLCVSICLSVCTFITLCLLSVRLWTVVVWFKINGMEWNNGSFYRTQCIWYRVESDADFWLLIWKPLVETGLKYSCDPKQWSKYTCWFLTSYCQCCIFMYSFLPDIVTCHYRCRPSSVLLRKLLLVIVSPVPQCSVQYHHKCTVSFN